MRNDTKMSKTRGRPRKFDETQAVAAAMNVFWKKGFSATSLDDLSEATGINRPSLYNAFGDKEAIYRRSLQMMRGHMQHAAEETLGKPVLRDALVGLYNAAIDVYLSTNPQAGCFVFCTAPAEAINHPDLKADMRNVLDEIDEMFQARFIRALKDRELPDTFDAKTAAKLAQAILHSIALRARSGETKNSLRKFARHAVEVVIGSAVSPQR